MPLDSPGGSTLQWGARRGAADYFETERTVNWSKRGRDWIGYEEATRQAEKKILDVTQNGEVVGVGVVFAWRLSHDRPQ